MKKRVKKKKKNKENIREFFQTLKPILIFSFIINLILIGYIYYLKVSSHIYLFSGSNEYLSIDSGALSLNYDVNYLVGNNIEYINEEDLKIKELKIGYYVLDNEKLEEITFYYETFEESESLKNVIHNITGLNVSESAKENIIFKNTNVKDLETKLYLVMEAKLDNGETLASKLQLDVSKIK